MKILFDHQRFGTQQYGGISRYFYELASQLHDIQNGGVGIFAPIYVNEYIKENDSIRPRGLKIPRIPKLGLTVGLLNTALATLAIRPRQDIDIFHETYYSKFDCCPRSAKRVVTVFDMIHEKYPKSFSSLDKTSEAKAHAVRRADHVICISEHTRRDLLEQFGVAPEKTSVVYLGHSLQATTPSQQRQYDGDAPFVLYVGERGGYKNFSALVRAFAASRLPAEGIRLVCFGGGALSTRETTYMREYGLDPALVVWRSGADTVLADLYCRARLFVYPSLYEGFGIPPLEAMAMGCPVACTNSSSLPEVVGEAAVLFDPESDEQIVAALECVTFSSGRAQWLAAQGLERARLFSWRKCAEDTLGVYRRICGE
ncbi:glycosyltransferase family 4 protein [Rhodanobacter glycinis]|uniref:Glycosyltransferase involved in cell wall bisynthesis n=1 Tax=Rhodanobacter glycinis TaxID=582702 RepID=A0A1I4BF31_9GAMM|nr:glycosyltransferase family 1 protein [Rhodanobacter glycinis]SFK67462.1 Glycosyltransferase involved in cell wall bisynthesis [Rhodanobacter glycinis]